MNHNELVGWRDKDASKAVVFLNDEDDYERVKMRFRINKQVIRKYTPNIIDINAKGKSYWEKVFYFIHLTDWASVMLAELRKQDATEVRVIDHLKKELSKVQ
jgi:glucose/mannose-6-phosphate isomerase